MVQHDGEGKFPWKGEAIIPRSHLAPLLTPSQLRTNSPKLCRKPPVTQIAELQSSITQQQTRITEQQTLITQLETQIIEQQTLQICEGHKQGLRADAKEKEASLEEQKPSSTEAKLREKMHVSQDPSLDPLEFRAAHEGTDIRGWTRICGFGGSLQ